MSDLLRVCQICFTSTQFLLRSLSLRNITEHHLNRSAPLVHDRVRYAFCADFRSIGTKKADLGLTYIHRVVVVLLDFLFNCPSVTWVHRVEELLSDEFFGG